MMRGLLSLTVVCAMFGALACGGDKPRTAPTSTPTEEGGSAPAVTATKPAATAEPDDEPQSSGAGGGIAGVFGSLLASGLNGPGGSGLVGGDESLKAFLPSESDLPDGYAPMGTFTFSTPDGISEGGAMDIAAMMAVKGDLMSPEDLSGVEMLMAMVIRPEDLQEIGAAIESIEEMSAEEIEDEFRAGAGDFGGMELKSVRVLEADGLGEGGAGFEMTIDMGGLFDLFGGGGGDVPAGLSTMSMRMYFFGRGDYAGAVMRIAFADGFSGDADELGLARIIDAKLAER